MDDEDRRAQHKIRWELAQYEGKLYWSRFQTASVIEGAMLTAIYYVGVLDDVQRLFAACFGWLMVFIICVWALKDARDAAAHVEHANLLQGPGTPEFPRAKDVLWLSGTQWTHVAIWIICIFNGLVIWEQAGKLCK